MDPPLFKIVYYLKFEYFLHFSNFDVILIKLDKLVADSIFPESENGPQIFWKKEYFAWYTRRNWDIDQKLTYILQLWTSKMYPVLQKR